MVADNIKKNIKFTLTSIFTFAVCFFLHAEEAENNLIYYGTSNIVCKEYIFEDTVSPVVKQDTSPKVVKKTVKIKKEAPAPVEKEVFTEQEPVSVVFPALPTPSSPSYSPYDSESAVISPQLKLRENLPKNNTNWVNTCPDSKKSFLSLFFSKQRQKLSTAATQYGVLTSFGSQSPPLEHYVIART